MESGNKTRRRKSIGMRYTDSVCKAGNRRESEGRGTQLTIWEGPYGRQMVDVDREAGN
jgi:hypothetical protein